ncbi:MAG: hypothetical protein JWQ68_1735 [Cryobacterium sp.]|nr:hypothetical protein [Cryobacterium sp.]
MPSKYPPDRFDTLPRRVERVGAHRPPGKRGRGWVGFWWALVATLVLIGIGVIGLFLLNNRLDLPGVAGPTAVATPPAEATPSASPTPTPTPTPAEEPTAEPTVDPSLSVTVLNGTPGTGVARAVGEILADAGWDVGATSDADSEDVPTTTVYYADPSLEGAARGVAASVTGSDILLSSDYADTGASLTVVVGNDYPVDEG